MNKEVLSKKRKALRPSVTILTNEIDKKIAEGADREQLTTLRSKPDEEPVTDIKPGELLDGISHQT